MQELISSKSRFDGQSHHGAFREHLKHRWKWWLRARQIACVMMAGIGAFILIKYAGLGDKRADFISIAFILLGSVGFIRPMIWQMYAERKFRKHVAYGTTITYDFSSEGVKMRGEAGDADVPWSAFTEVVDTDKGLLIYQNKKDFIWIPVRDFAEGEMSKVVNLFLLSK